MNRNVRFGGGHGRPQDVVIDRETPMRNLRLWRGAAVVLLSVSLVTTGCFRPSGSTRALRDCVLAEAGEGWAAEVELGVGPLTFGLARNGSRFLELPDEVRTLLGSMRAADVGVYRYYGVERPKSGSELLRAADRGLSQGGWERMIAVLDGRETVGLYVPDQLDPGGQLRLCVLVVSESELVIVSARGKPEPLIQLALEKVRESAPPRGAKPI